MDQAADWRKEKGRHGKDSHKNKISLTQA
jgi:hypothetical protein